MILGTSGAVPGESASSPVRVAALVGSEALSGPGPQLTAPAAALKRAGIACLVVAFQGRRPAAAAFRHALARPGVEEFGGEDRRPLGWRGGPDVEDMLRGRRAADLQR